MEIKVNKFGKFSCPCCEFFTLEKFPNNTFQICPVCYWEDDGIQLDDPTYEGGANIMSLQKAKMIFLEIGAIDITFINYVRLPILSELRD
jgi:hypothetical protein